MKVIGNSTVTGKFQVTIPKPVRELLSLNNGDFLVFIEDSDRIVVKRGIVSVQR